MGTVNCGRGPEPSGCDRAPSPKTKRLRRTAGAFRIQRSRRNAYLSAVWTLVKVVFNFEPRPCTTAMMATEMPAAIRPYSMAVAPDSSFTNVNQVLHV